MKRSCVILDYVYLLTEHVMYDAKDVYALHCSVSVCVLMQVRIKSAIRIVGRVVCVYLRFAVKAENQKILPTI